MLHNVFWLCFDLFLAKVESGFEEDYVIPNLENENMLTIFKSQHAQVPIPPAKEDPAEQSEAHKKVN